MIEENYLNLRKAINSVALDNRRDPKEIKLIAVTKTVVWNKASSLYSLGQRDFGENRIQDALEKMHSSPSDCNWHLIGTLQSNKLAKVIGKFALIHSVDKVELVHKISKHSQLRGLETAILLQVNTSGEISKHGLPPEQWKEYYKTLLDLPGISIRGLMTIAPLSNQEHLVRDCFKRLRLLREELNYLAPYYPLLTELSMGMSQDFRWAIAEGATLLRIGSLLFNDHWDRRAQYVQ